MNETIHSKTPNLVSYVARKNVFADLSGSKPIDLNYLTVAEKQSIRQSVEGDLSPENLCCDGEASPAYVRKRAKFLNTVLAELESA